MSSQLLFPNIRPLNDPPPCENTIHHGHRTPCYALAWKCHARKYSTRITEANLDLDVNNVGEEALVNRTQRPIVQMRHDGDLYQVAMFNSRHFQDYASRAQNPDDPLIVAAKYVLFVTDELQLSFKWYRYPMHWAQYYPDSDEEDLRPSKSARVIL